MTGALQLLDGRQRHAEDALRRLVICRHEYGRAAVRQSPQILLARKRHDRRLDAEDVDQEAGDGGHEGQRQPGDVEDEQADQHDFELGIAADRQHEAELAGQIGGQQRRPAEHEGAPKARADIARIAAPVVSIEAPQILLRKFFRRIFYREGRLECLVHVLHPRSLTLLSSDKPRFRKSPGRFDAARSADPSAERLRAETRRLRAALRSPGCPGRLHS